MSGERRPRRVLEHHAALGGDPAAGRDEVGQRRGRRRRRRPWPTADRRRRGRTGPARASRRTPARRRPRRCARGPRAPAPRRWPAGRRAPRGTTRRAPRGGAPRERLEGERAGAGVEVEHPRALDGPGRREDAEERLAHPVRGRPGRRPLGARRARERSVPPVMRMMVGARIQRVFAERRAPALLCANAPCDRAGAHGARRVPSSLPSAPALAEPPNGKATPVYVLSIWTNDVGRPGRRAHAGAAVARAPGAGLVAGRDEPVVRDALASRCVARPRPTSSCLDRIGDQLHADHYVWGTMARKKAGRGDRRAAPLEPRQAADRGERVVQRQPQGPERRVARGVAGRLFAKLTSSGVDGHARRPRRHGGGLGARRRRREGQARRRRRAARRPEGVAHRHRAGARASRAPSRPSRCRTAAKQEMSFALTPVEARRRRRRDAGRSRRSPSRRSRSPCARSSATRPSSWASGFLVARGHRGARGGSRTRTRAIRTATASPAT